MWCFVSQPNSVVLEVEVDPKADGQECLDKVCRQLEIIEVDYFGLQFLANKGERLWLNLRNKIDEQLGGAPPYRLQLRVKFFVQPHLLLQDTTRHQVYLQIRQEIQAGHLKPVSDEQGVQLAAIMAQADYGDISRTILANQNSFYKSFPICSSDLELSVNSIVEAHTGLQGVSRESAEYRFLSIASELEKYGVEEHFAKSIDEIGVNINLGVGPEGLLIRREDSTQIQHVEYPMIKLATHAGKCLFLTVFNTRLNGKDNSIGFRLASQRAANALYRCVTEMHSFYRCDTVRNVVLDQYSRDLKGLVASLFNENTSLGKKYVFDIRRTCREAYDYARRKLYSQQQQQQMQNNLHDQLSSGQTSQQDVNTTKGSNSQYTQEQEYKELKERLEIWEDALLCHVCVDASIDCVLCPCGHVICCQNCAKSFDTCPVCRSDIGQIQPLYLPINTMSRNGQMTMVLNSESESESVAPSTDNLLSTESS